MIQDYYPILLHMVIVVALALVLMGLSSWVGVRRPSRVKNAPYECGIPPVGNAREKFSISFYLVGMLFILFDVEVAFLFPWAVVYKSLNWFGFIEMVIFIAVLFAGYVYIWKKGALDWSQ
jgi:NADH-quinone oxidoreductase subunit A